MADLACPYCSLFIGEHVTDYGDCACAACGLCAPRDVLEALAARLALASEMYDLIGRASQRAKPSKQASAWMDDAATLRARWQCEVLTKGERDG